MNIRSIVGFIRWILLAIVLLIAASDWALSATRTYSTREKQNFEIEEIISETRTIIFLIERNGGKDFVLRLNQIISKVENAYRSKEYVEQLELLRCLRAEISFCQSKFYFAMAALVQKSNTNMETEALKFINRILFLCDNVKKRINKVR